MKNLTVLIFIALLQVSCNSASLLPIAMPANGAHPNKDISGFGIRMGAFNLKEDHGTHRTYYSDKEYLKLAEQFCEKFEAWAIANKFKKTNDTVYKIYDKLNNQIIQAGSLRPVHHNREKYSYYTKNTSPKLNTEIKISVSYSLPAPHTRKTIIIHCYYTSHSEKQAKQIYDSLVEWINREYQSEENHFPTPKFYKSKKPAE